MVQCTACGAEYETLQNFCAKCGATMTAEAAGLRGGAGDLTGGIIPYRNPPALLAYYIGLFALIPLLGIPLGILSVTLGIIGLKKMKERPEIRGGIHAWLGIVLGGLFALGNIGLILLLVGTSG